ncbi:hypothetical protein OG762_50915 (plasmid) [Streptomyces sp. NBC_01136]|uniref:hypothetical protein n=1 Tax=unclassified Streptomyces TaxID=2593676 RepID=UPI002F91166E|nr:hypothetical protein OG762_50915 [Streptomyces sp. NBC_01136]
MSPVCGIRTEQEKAGPGTARRMVGEREDSEQQKLPGAEYRSVALLADRLVVVLKPL